MYTDSQHRRLLRFTGFVPIDQSEARISNRHADEELAFSLERLNLQLCKSVWEIREKEIDAFQHLKRFKRQKELSKSLTSVDMPRIVVALRRRDRHMSPDLERRTTEPITETMQWKRIHTVPPRRKVYSRNETPKGTLDAGRTPNPRSQSAALAMESSVNKETRDVKEIEDMGKSLLRRHSSLSNKNDRPTTNGNDNYMQLMREAQCASYSRASHVPVLDRHKSNNHIDNQASDLKVRNSDRVKVTQIKPREKLSWVKASVKLDIDPIVSEDEQITDSNATKRNSSFRHLRKRPTIGKVRSKKELISLTHFDNILAVTESEKKDKRDKEKREIQRIRDDRLSDRLQTFYHKVDDLEYKKPYDGCEDSSKSFIFYKYL